MNFKLTCGESIRIYLRENENTAVRIAAENLVKDLQAALGVTAEMNDDAEMECKSAEIKNQSDEAESQSTEIERQSDEAKSKGVKTGYQCVETECKIILKTGITADTAGAAKLADEKNGYHREGFSIAVSDGRMYITGADRRGTIYGIYDFCESIGVSPWYWWADVPVKQKDAFEIPDGFLKTDYPSVEYRGIFINDEEELENWVKAHMGEDTIGVKTYEHVFELLLRLKANYIWPAMHVNSFNVKRENGALADRVRGKQMLD
ncbi:MAG: glycosyl hydrolase 115 family protein [Lachnospiraceae bacterium]|nr:glycosyl hydrolase 115 family protein [Lachnospiraceae bacterium]